MELDTRTKTAIAFSGVALFLAVGVGVYWYYSEESNCRQWQQPAWMNDPAVKAASEKVSKAHEIELAARRAGDAAKIKEAAEASKHAESEARTAQAAAEKAHAGGPSAVAVSCKRRSA